jgi:GNAT superfamily N-acetyltransferase
MSRMDQSTYERLLPNGFTGEAATSRRSGPATRRTGRLTSGVGASGVGAGMQVTVNALAETDLPAVIAMLGRCSRGSLYKRFHGFTDGVAHATEAVAGRGQDAFGAWRASTCIGMASLAVDHEGYGEMGVLVEDRWQRRGAGSALVRALVARAKDLRLAGLIADIIADNYFLLPLLAQVGAITTTFAYSGYRLRVGFGSPLAAASVRGDFPVWGSE